MKEEIVSINKKLKQDSKVENEQIFYFTELKEATKWIQIHSSQIDVRILCVNAKDTIDSYPLIMCADAFVYTHKQLFDIGIEEALIFQNTSFSSTTNLYAMSIDEYKNLRKININLEEQIAYNEQYHFVLAIPEDTNETAEDLLDYLI